MTGKISSNQAYSAVGEQQPDHQTDRSKSHGSSRMKDVFTTHHDHWYPLSLRPTGLIFFATTLLLILAALISIFIYARGRDGLDLVTTNHYTWTYGPTAVFIIVTSYWRLVDYHTKALTPWAELANGPATADRSLFLDYISPFLAESLVLAMRRGHFAVCMTITGFLLLKVTTIASTGLFFRESIVVGPFEQQMLQTSQFDIVTNFSDFSDPGASPFYEAYAVMQLGLPLPSGLTHELLYETYKPVTSSLETNATYLVPSRAFAPKVSCEAVDVEAVIDWDEFGSTTSQYERLRVLNSSEWTCPSETMSSDYELNLQVIDIASRLAPKRQILSSFGRHDCKRAAQDDKGFTVPYLTALSDVRYNQTFNISTSNITIGDMIKPANWSFAIPKITGMLCTVDYEIVNINVFYNMSLTGNFVQDIDIIGPSNPARFQNLPNEYLSRKLGYASPTSVMGARDMFGLATRFTEAEEPPSTVLTMVAKRAGTDLKYLIDHTNEFRDATEYVLRNMLLQIAKEAIVVPDTNSTFVPRQALSQEKHFEERLVLQTTPFLVAAISIFILLLISLAVLLIRPNAYTSINPETSLAKIDSLKTSENLNKRLSALALTSEKAAHSSLAQSMYQRDTAGSSIISFSLDDDGRPPHAIQDRPNTAVSGYAPLALSGTCIALTLISALAGIGALEALQRLSDSGFPGITTISTTSSFTVSIYSRFLPAVIALLIATSFNCLDFNTMMLAPYNHLTTENGSYEEFGTPILAHIAPVAVFTALRRRYWAASLTGICALVGSLLTLVVSGLYTVENIPTPRDITITGSDSWNMSYIQGMRTDGGSTAVSSLIESANLSYPQFTYDELVFPTLDTSADFDGRVQAAVPALRSDLVCEELPWETSNASIAWIPYKTTGSSAIKFNITVPLPQNCHYGSCYGNETSIRVTLLSAGLNEQNTTYYAQAIDLHTGPWRADDDSCDIFFTESGDVETDQNVNQPGCPSMLFVYGYFDGNDVSRSTWTSLLCEQKVQQVNTSLVMSLPSKDVVLDAVPVPNEASATYIQNGDSGETTFGWWLNGNMDYSYIMFNKSAIDPILLGNETSVSNEKPDFSNFFRGAFFGRTPLPLHTMQKNDTASKDLIFQHINKFYRRYMAQVFSANLRVQTARPNAKRDDRIINTPAITGSFTPDTGTPRLVQHRTPKIVLQAMLAFMFSCAVAALLLGRYRNLVLWNPCTIAGVMVLFAGSKMCEPDTMKKIDAHSESTQDQDSTAITRGDYEMINFSKPRKIGLKEGSCINVQSEEISILRDSQGLTSGDDLKDESATYRLGWWRDGVFMGQKRPEPLFREVTKWRYGIDRL